jgi:hypothetical protein
MIYEHRQYLIFPTNQLHKVDFTQVLETSQDTVRKSVDETKTFVKWENEPPSFISQLTHTEGPYTHNEILDILATEQWNSPQETEI